jgi:hypothetical protein
MAVKNLPEKIKRFKVMETNEEIDCLECGKRFLSIRGGHSLCSTACRKKSAKKKRAYIPKEAVCRNCKKVFKEKQEWDVFCTDKCRKTWKTSSVTLKCQVCSKEFPITGYRHQKYCSKECRNSRYSGLASKYKTEHKEKGLCSQCSNQIMKGHSDVCEYHWFDRAARSNGFRRVRDRVKILKEILERQNYTCPYTGKKLIPGLNASIDHKNPRARFPEQYSLIENIEWVDLFVNNAKNTMTKDEFISFCKLIASRFQ